ncbi:GntR family transcriptional regulator [Streptomyces iconiensis]|uniref:GntR family transcriptional regulator n=1 Tax=Streptomyces iconiensis TaxID=1384038 RepID=A0ABT7A7U7_9ACTN|nr:GntR family transcriptional regulator [Streptomyces iconiensis]MDJ1137376.1 GntR family transcriptional regulator [Streptomyces iconiensis]
MTTQDPLPREDATSAAPTGPAVALARTRLLERLDREEFPPGAQLPGERQLAKETGVSRSSLRNALALLKSEGRLDSSAQRGWFVRAGVVSEPAGVLQSFTDIARARGLVATGAVLVQQVRSADFDEAGKLRIAPASDVVHLVRVRALDGLPVCVETSVLPRARVPELEQADMTDRSLFAAIEELGGRRVSRSHYAAQACGADAHQAELLRIGPGEPVLVCEEITVDQSNTPVLLGKSVYRGDAYRFESVLHRSQP